MSHRPTGPACGNNPNFRMSDGDRQAVEDFRAYLADRAQEKTMTNRYVLRPFHIEAVQWTDTNAPELEAFAGDRFMTLDPQDRIEDPDATAALRESFHETWKLLHPGAWVIKRPDGLFITLGDEQFREAYRPDVEQAPAADRAALREQIAEAALRAVETAMDDTLLPAAREKALVGIAAVLPAPTDRAAVLRAAADAAAEKHRLNPWTTAADVIADVRRMAAEDAPLSPFYEHPDCGFRWHGRDGMDIPMRDGQPVCPGCELRRMADEAQPAEAETEDPLCICMHRRSQHPKISGRLLCDECDPDSTENLVCKEYTAL
jgi:hypothetical protein